jgi:uncharacterized protein
MNEVRHQRLFIPVGKKGRVSALLAFPPDDQAIRGTGVVFAHGAGNNMDHPLLVTLCQGLVRAGYLTMRFNFPYTEKGMKAPDSQSTLMLTWESVYRFLMEESGYGVTRFVAAGKSMGGRVASQMVAQGLLPAHRLIFLGYPLHAAGKEEKLRDEHLYRIGVPMLFFAGTRDALCNLEILRKVLARLAAPWDLEIIEGGDHSFALPKSLGTSREAVENRILTKITEWLRGTDPVP